MTNQALKVQSQFIYRWISICNQQEHFLWNINNKLMSYNKMNLKKMVTNLAFLANCYKSQNDKFQAMSEWVTRSPLTQIQHMLPVCRLLTSVLLVCFTILKMPLQAMFISRVVDEISEFSLDRSLSVVDFISANILLTETTSRQRFRSLLCSMV